MNELKTNFKWINLDKPGFKPSAAQLPMITLQLNQHLINQAVAEQYGATELL